MSLPEILQTKITEAGNGPFLFCGSGLSRRYIKLETWADLLRRFCPQAYPFEYYLSSADGNLDYVATLMQDDFNKEWWKYDEYKETRERYKDEIKTSSSPLKSAIADYMIRISNDQSRIDTHLLKEMEYLKKVNVDGIITTNYDLYLESIFPEYEVFIGQEELLVADYQGIGEIYKIHGCCTQPNSLVLNRADYDYFTEKNNYLAAKLLTIFIEHPVLFLGYSISDKNIKAILKSILMCPGVGRSKLLQNKLFFIEREGPERKDGLTQSTITLDDVELPVTRIITNDFSEIYSILGNIRRKIPAKVLRNCKSQFYDLIKTEDPKGKIAVIDLDGMEEKSDLEFVIGLGVKARIGDIGYSGGIPAEEIFRDIVFDDKDYDSKNILTETLPLLFKRNDYLPVFKYIKKSGLSISALNLPPEKARKILPEGISFFSSPQYIREFERDCKDKDLEYIINNYQPEKAAVLAVLLDLGNISIEQLKVFIIENIEKINRSVSSYSSAFRKLVCIYDYLKYGE